MLGPILYYVKGNWADVLLAAIVFGLIAGIAVRFGSHWDGLAYNVIQLLWISVLLSQLLGFSADSWPTGERTFPVVPLVLLFLAAASALKSTNAAANGMSILFWMGLFLLGIVVAAGIWDIKAEYLYPKPQGIEGNMMLIFLIPAVTGFIITDKSSIRTSLCIALTAAVISVWIAGILSPGIAEQEPWPFYESAKNVALFNVAKRFEALVSAGITICNYGLYSLLLCAIGEIGEKLGRRREAVIGGVGISASLLLLGLTIRPEVSAVFCIVLWVVFPLLGLMKKNKNE